MGSSLEKFAPNPLGVDHFFFWFHDPRKPTVSVCENGGKAWQCTQSPETSINPLHTGRLFHCCMLVESICHFRGVGLVYCFILF